MFAATITLPRTQSMLALTAGGRERTGDEFAELGATFGLRLERTVHLPSSSAAHILRRTEGVSVM